MYHWILLGIEPTKDKRAIKLAYTQLLKQTPPAEFPEEFKALRKAYDQALEEISKSDDDANDNSASWHDAPLKEFQPQLDTNIEDRQDEVFSEPAPSSNHYTDDDEPVEFSTIKTISQLNLALTQLYSDILVRYSLEQWKMLFAAPIFWDVNQSNALTANLLDFFSNHHFLPENIWTFLDDSLSISGGLSISGDDTTRQIAIALSRYIKTLPKRINDGLVVGISEHVDFKNLQRHLEIRNYIEDRCLYGTLTSEDLENIAEQIEPEFKTDFPLYDYIVKYLWTLNAYSAIKRILTPLAIPDTEKDLLDYQAHAEYKLKNYELALKLYIQQEHNCRDFCTKVMFKSIGLCYLKLNNFEKAYLYLDAETYAVADMGREVALITARRGYIRELRADEAKNAIKIATLLYENGRYHDALSITEQYKNIFIVHANYLQALCLCKLSRFEEAYSEFLLFIDLYDERQLWLWPLIVDLSRYCYDLITFELFAYTLQKNIAIPSDFYKIDFFPGSTKPRCYTEQEMAILELTSEQDSVRRSLESVWHTESLQIFALAILNVRDPELIAYTDTSVVDDFQLCALHYVKVNKQFMLYNPRDCLRFLEAAFGQQDFDTCIMLADIAIKGLRAAPQAYYFKGCALLELNQYDTALAAFQQAAHEYNTHPYAVHSLNSAIKCCEELIEQGLPYAPQRTTLCQQLQETKEKVDA
ncbi:tetratricopeptide repeat protein [Pseudoalteromonas rhizosphaerae]|uniref:tetratricopeptide repeat protein n=1 Tax=Pseudoalteromonas rhizosphaerae TaxID=2518973 RepID=UPI0012310DE2|nr:tetratricopeptide repeat protein [Pseudoalteromonas rhizosphaerae]